jgi:hypothetical protein
LGAQSREVGIAVPLLEITFGARRELGNGMRKHRERAIPLFDELIAF